MTKSCLQLILTTCLLPLLFLSACTPIYEAPLKVGSNNWWGYRPLYYGMAKRIINKEDLKMIEFGSATDVVRAFRNGNLDGACLTIDEVILLASEGYKPRIVLAFDESSGADVLLFHPSKKKFKGTKIGVEQGALGAFMLSRAAEKLSLPVKDMSIVNLEFDQHEQAYRLGKVDGLITFEPVKSKILKLGAKTLFDSSMIPGEIVDVLVFNEDTVAAHPEKVQAVVQGWFEALKAFKKDSAYLVENNFNIETFGLKYKDKKENLDIFKLEKKAHLAKYQRIEKVMLEQNLIHHQVLWDDLVLDQFVIKSGELL